MGEDMATSFELAPVRLDFEPDLFQVSVEKMKKESGQSPAGALAIDQHPRKPKAPPLEPTIDAEKPGFAAFKQSRTSRKIKAKANSKGAGAVEASEKTDGAEGAPADVSDEDDEVKAWEQLGEEDRKVFEVQEAESQAEYQKQLEEYERLATAPTTSYTVSLRETALIRRVLRLPTAWRVVEFVTVAGLKAQQAEMTKVKMNYDVSSKKLKVSGTIRYAASEE